MDLGLKGKKVVVTGAANGIGSSVFQSLLKEGAYPIGIDICNFGDSELKGELDGHSEGKHYLFFTSDVSNGEEMKSLFENNSGLDGLVNNAALLGGDESHGGRSLESWKKVIDTNVRSAFILTELLYPKMENSGSIINMGSIQFGMTAPGSVLYTSAKGALYGMTISYAVELGKRNIRVNMISPGNVNTPRNLAQYEESIGIVKGYEGKTPLGRSVESEEVSDLVLFLLSDRSKAITGQNYIIDCGHTVSLWDPVWDRKA